MPKHAKIERKVPAKRAGPPRAAMKRMAPAAQSSNFRTRRPRFEYVDKDTIRISHTEYFGDLLTDPANEFAYSVWEVNPGNVELMPWLSPIAQRYESYSFESLRVHYSPASPTSLGGKALLALDFDAADVDDSYTKAQLLAFEGSLDGSVWADVHVSATKAQLNKIGPTRFVTNESGTEDRTAMAAKLFTGATSVSPLQNDGGSPPNYAVITLGELFIEYVVLLKTPAVAPALTGERLTYSSNLGTSGTDVLAGLRSPVSTVTNPSVVVENAGTSTKIARQNTATNWVSAAGSVVPATQKVIKFVDDFVGQIDFVSLADSSGISNPFTGVTPTVVPLTQPAQGGVLAETPPDTVLSAGLAGPVVTTIAGQLMNYISILINAKKGTALAINLLGLAGYTSNFFRRLIIVRQNSVPKQDLDRYIAQSEFNLTNCRALVAPPPTTATSSEGFTYHSVDEDDALASQLRRVPLATKGRYVHEP